MWARLGRGWLRKSQRRRFVTVRGVRCKRVILHDAHLAAHIERNLEAFGPSPRLPSLITRFENEIWVEFVPGERLRRGDSAVIDEVAQFYGELYARSPRRIPAAETPYLVRAQRDLEFLCRTGLLAADAHRDLHAAAERLAPEQLWVGFDYVDPVLKNFVRRADGGPLCSVDVESLEQDSPLGTGIAKAGVHWLTADERERLLARLGPGVPDIRAQLPFVELCFLARWTKTKLLTGKYRFLREDRFARFRAAGKAQGDTG